MIKKIFKILVILIIFVMNTGVVQADDSIETSKINWIEGPKTVDVGNNLAKLDLSSEYIFADGKDAKSIMKTIGNSVSGMEQGIVFSKDTNEEWFVLFEFNNMGYVKDEDSNKIDSDKLLSQIKEATEEDNKQRRKDGNNTLDIIGWDEKPHYDPNTHNLTWSVLCSSEGEKIVNYNVRILGRDGVTEVTLVANKNEIESVKPNLDSIISNYSYKEGKRYTDYIKGDKVSKIGGLAALIAGGSAASKAGIFAKIFIVFKKIWILIVVGISGVFRKIKNIFKKKDDEFNL
ncbi:DUF2167 domain-containing protein [Clostridium weizhouense]|uniref:DUF2167 domain-containing protein n=1 Tax=Clostridium weizhouense TaxID=2859781 RepID=A0ABS7AMQ7_9CLOT|nr:DUF2167 domain-containing protein [Clostridium weizhouense]MBW6409691.1 DUF2167 domain-containing protein [Clostridium weizhouense]